MYKKLLFLMLMVLVISGNEALNAQVISQPLQSGQISLQSGGQSFTATVTGTVTQVDVQFQAGFTLDGTNNANILFYSGALGSGTVGNRGVPVYEEPINITGAGFGTWIPIVLTVPFAITSGNQYSVIWEHNTAAWPYMNTYFDGVGPPGPYVGGTVIDNYANSNSNYDIVFQIHQAAAPPPPPPSVPLSVLGIIAAVLLIGGYLFIRRRRAATV